MLSLPLLFSLLHRGLPGLREHRLQLLLFRLCPKCASATRDQAWLSLGHPPLQASPEQKEGICSLLEGAGPRDSVRAGKPPGGSREGGNDSRGRQCGLCPHPASIPDSSVASQRAAGASGRREPAPHAEGAREGASFLWGCTRICGFCCKQTAHSGGRGAPRSPPTHRGPRQAVCPTPVTQTHRCAVGQAVGRERNSDTVLTGRA